MLSFGFVVFSLKEPVEGDEPNQVVSFVSSLGLVKDLTLFEVAYILKRVFYPNVFQFSLHVSRVFDNNPDLVLQNKLKGAMNKLRGALLICELATGQES